MLRMTPLASAIVALLLGIEAYAAEETFDTHFMIGGMKDQQVANIRLDDNQPLPGQYDIDMALLNKSDFGEVSPVAGCVFRQYARFQVYLLSSFCSALVPGP